MRRRGLGLGGPPRGQSTVELALASLVFVTVLMFGIYFGEVGYLSVQVQKAHAFAMFDATGRRVSSYGGGSTLAAAANQAAAGTEAEYAALNDISHVYTEVNGLDVRCQTNSGVGTNRLRWSAAGRRTQNIYPASAAVVCQASAKMKAFRLPTEFLDEGQDRSSNSGTGEAGKFFAIEHHTGDITACSTGRMRNGVCRFGPPILLGDWGLSGVGESGDCGPGACANGPYRSAVAQMWGGGVFGGAEDFANTYAFGAPATGGEFNMVYRGVDSPDGPYMQSMPGHGIASSLYNTSGTTSDGNTPLPPIPADWPGR